MRRVLLTCAALLTAASTARAEPLPVSITNTLVFEGHTDSGGRFAGDEGYTILIDRLTLQSRFEAFDVALRLDAVGFSDTPRGSQFEPDARPERITGRYHAGDVELTVGDYVRQLGRGFLLSIRKVDEVGLDLSLRGVDARWSPSGHAMSLFAGVLNPANLDAVSQKPVADPADLVAGAAYELTAVDRLVLGVHGVYLQPGERLLPDELDFTASGGGYAEVHELVEGLTLYAEGAAQVRRLAGAEQTGWAAYLTADLALGDLSLLVEAMWLDDFEQKGSKNSALDKRFDLNQPPTLERIDQEVANNRDVRGVRARAEYAFDEGRWLAYLNGVFRVNDASTTAELQQVHLYAGGEHAFDEDQSKATLSGGFRNEAQGGARLKSMGHGELELQKVLGETLTLHFTGNIEVRNTPDGLSQPERTWIRGSTFLGLDWAAAGSFTVELGYDTEDVGARQVFVAGLVGRRISETFSVRATVGTQRGGLKCANGVCRDFPEFAGARAEIVARL